MQCRCIAWTGLVLLLTMSAQAVHAENRVHALLVGVTSYPNLPAGHYLRGPAKDVVMMAESLERFDAEITTLSENGTADQRPSRANIEREFKRLTADVQEGDQVVILFAGHGDRTPNDNPEEDPEVDGMDEVFLPRDAKLESDKYVNVISDDDLNRWLTELRNAGVSVLYISDSCHSDTQTRGDVQSTDEGPNSRGLDLLAHVAPSTRGTPELEPGKSCLDLNADSGSLVAFFAARNKEPTPDRFKAPGADKREHQGLLTYTICKILNAYPGITYRELGQRIQQQYRLYSNVGIEATVPHPTSTGVDLDRVVLSDQWKVGRSRFTFTVRGDIKITGGAIDGLTKGSILKLLPTAGEGDGVLGWALIDTVNSRDSLASLVDYDEKTGNWTKRLTLPKSLSAGRCEIESIEYVGQKFTVFLDKTFPSYLGDDSRTQFETLLAELKTQASASNAPYKLVDVDEAEFLLGVTATRGPELNPQLVLRTRFDPVDLTPPAVFHFGPIDGDSKKRVINRFERISRAKRLVNIALRTSSGNSRGIQFSITAETSDTDGGEFREVDLNDGIEIPVGKYVRFRIRNHSPTPIRVTLLYVRDDFGIDPLLPREQDEVNEIPPMKDGVPGEKLVDVGADLPITSRMPESIVAIATRKKGLGDADYTYLKQSPLDATWVGGANTAVTKGVRAVPWETSERSRGQRSPLGYLAEIGFNPSQSRAMRTGKVPDHAFSVLSWKATDRAYSKSRFDLAGTTKQMATGPWEPMSAEIAGRGFGATVFPKVAPAVVVVRTDGGHGTGFFISDDGWIVTNHHVVSSVKADTETGIRSAKIHIGKLNDSGWMEMQDSEFIADIYKWNEDKDLALLKVRDVPRSRKFPFLRLARKQITPGSDCVAVGHPAAGSLWLLRSGEVQGSAVWPSEKIDAVMARLSVSRRERPMLEEYLRKQPKRRVLISSCGCNPGDSGGPLVNADGEVIAVTFATPIVDVEKGVSLDEFTYHIDLGELRRFISNPPRSPLVIPPEIWGLTNRGKLTTLSNHEVSDTFVVTKDGNWRESVFAVDLDRDSSLAAYRDAETLSDAKEVWDFEFALVLSEQRGIFACYYDTDNDKEIDLVLQDVDPSRSMDIEWKLDKSTGRWKRSKLTAYTSPFYYQPLERLLGETGRKDLEDVSVALQLHLKKAVEADEQSAE